MFIVNKDAISIVNSENITNIYLGADSCTIKADYKNGTGCQLAKYSSKEEAKTAMMMLAENIGGNEVYFMPADEAVKAKMNQTERRYHHIDGKKTKGHGGS